MYICDKCGKLCEDDDLPTYEEDFGYDTGVGWRSAKQTFVDNCSCGGEFVEAKECAICGEWFTDDEIINGYCKECLEEEMTYENAIKCGSENEESVAINGFLASCFDSSEIEEILLKTLNETKELMPSRIDEYVKAYCKDDLYYFAGWLEEQEC